MMSRPGTTLLELIVGLVLMSAALAAGYSAFNGVADQRERAVFAMNATAREALVRRTIGDWLRGARVTVDDDGPPFVGTDGIREGRSDDEVAFLTTAPTLAGITEGYVRLFIDRDPETPERGLVAELSEWRGPRLERIELVPEATALDVRYLSGPPNRFWVPSWISSSAVPVGVEIILAAAPDDPLPRLLRRPILAAVRGSP